MDIDKLTDKLLNDYITVRFLKVISKSEGVDIQAASLIAQEEIKNAIKNRNSNDMFFHFLETDVPDDSYDICYDCASQGYDAGYCDAVSDILRILAKYQTIAESRKGGKR